MSILDRGSLIIAAHDYHNTDESNSIMYTCNEGITWTAFTFSNDQITIFAVITEPGETTTVARLGYMYWNEGIGMGMGMRVWE